MLIFAQGKLLYCHAPPTLGEPAAKRFSELVYGRGGSKFEQAELARSMVARAYTEVSTEAIAAQEGRVAPSTMDKEFFAIDGKGQVKAGTVGRFQDAGEFSRVNVFPHQSGYIMQSVVNGGGDDAVSMSSVMSGRYADGTLGKKSHKTGKRRIKDRSWRA